MISNNLLSKHQHLEEKLFIAWPFFIFASSSNAGESWRIIQRLILPQAFLIAQNQTGGRRNRSITIVPFQPGYAIFKSVLMEIFILLYISNDVSRSKIMWRLLPSLRIEFTEPPGAKFGALFGHPANRSSQYQVLYILTTDLQQAVPMSWST